MAPAIFSVDGQAWQAGRDDQYRRYRGVQRDLEFPGQNRSPDLTLRARLDETLAPAFWLHQTFAHIVPDFDQAIIDGEVPLNIVGSQLALTGPGKVANRAVEFRDTGNGVRTFGSPSAGTLGLSAGEGGNAGTWTTRLTSDALDLSAVFAELEADGITVSLANIELARKTQAFANLRRQYNAHDEYIIDLLMDGITIPEQQWKQPILLFDQTTQFGMSSGMRRTRVTSPNPWSMA